MLSGHRSAWRRRGNKSRAARIAIPLAIPVALGLTLGIIIAVSGGSTTKIAQSAMGSCASAASTAAPAASASAPAAVASAPASAAAATAPCPSASGSAAAAAAAAAGATAANFAIPPNNAANRAGLAGANAVDAAGNTFSFNQNADQAAASMNCTVSVPANPLTAAGLASPWVLGDGCTWANGGTEGVFVEATILSPNGQLRGLRPAGDQPGHHPGRGADAADDRGGLAGHHQPRVQRQRAGPGGPGRGAGQLHRRVRQLDHQPDPAVQRGQLLPDGQRRDRPRHADGPADRHRQGRPGLPDHA